MVFQMKNMNQKFTKQQREYIIKLLQDGKDLPQEFKYLLFPTKQREYELLYAGKIRKEDLLANEDGVFPYPYKWIKFSTEMNMKHLRMAGRI